MMFIESVLFVVDALTLSVGAVPILSVDLSIVRFLDIDPIDAIPDGRDSEAVINPMVILTV